MTITARENTVKLQLDSDTFAIFPKGHLIALSDSSDMVSFKVLASRKTVYAEKNENITPHGENAKATVDMLNELL